MVYELQRAGMKPIARRGETRESFVVALGAFAPDIILLDFTLPHFDGKSAMQIARASVPDVLEAMISHRPYRPGLGRKAALKEITANQGGACTIRSGECLLPSV